MAAQGRGYAESIRLQGLVINAANGTGLLVSDSQVNILSSQFVASSGSAIRVEATAVLELGSVDFEANAGSNGSALYITGAGTEVEVKSSRFFNNTATVSGAIFQNASSQLSVVNSSFELNSGTAIAIDGATATINQSSFNTNAAATGGAIRTVGAVTLDVTQSEFNANSAADSGGAIALFSSGTVNISRSLFVDNLATNAGASLFVNQAANNLLVENSTFYANKAGADGGVLQLQSGVANLNYVTMVANTAGGDGGALQRTSGSLSLQRSLLLANTAVGSGDNINNSFTDADYNIVGFNNVGGMTNGAAVSAANSFTATDTPVGEDFSKVAVTLEEILDISPNFGGGDGYYGNLKTMPLLAGSIARDVIPLADCGLSEEDQRGELRPDGKNNACDIGAYEYTVLTCAEDAQRRYKQGEVFVKACTAKLKDFELGTFKPIGLFLLILMGFFRLPRLRQI
ncbi:MAG: hypothetical protein HRU20_26620 [Pseudomonadales bacterium]|nr:hypothetical protein [Pseudomonadales bacterium]